MSPIRLMIADDHRLFREGVKALLLTTGDIEVAAEAESGEAAVASYAESRPDVVLMDIHMPGLNGIEAARQILAADVQAAVIMLTMLEDDASVFAAMRAGARGYVLKGASPGEMLDVIRAVAGGQALFGQAIAARMLRFFQDLDRPQPAAQNAAPSAEKNSAPSVAASAGFGDLSTREREVLQLIADGYNNTEIAQRLVISPKTVRNHITSVFSKLQVADRSQAIRLARKA